MDDIFRPPTEYALWVAEKRERAKQQVVKEFKSKGHKCLFMLDSNHMAVLRDSFQNNPICHSALTRVCNTICVTRMLEAGLSEKIEEVVNVFKVTLQGSLQELICKVIRSVWIYGFVVLRESNDQLPNVLEDEEYILFRDRDGTIYARSIDDGSEKLTFVCKDVPDVHGRVTSAMSFVYEKSLQLRYLRECRDTSLRNACHKSFVTGVKDSSEESEAKLRRSEMDKLDTEVTERAIEAMMRARDGIPTRLDKSYLLEEELSHRQRSDDKRKLLTQYERSMEENIYLWRLIGDLKFNRLFNKSPPRNVIDDTASNVETLSANEKLEASSLDVRPLDIEHYEQEYNYLVVNVLMGTLLFQSPSSSQQRNKKQCVEGTNEIYDAIDQSSLAWQEFIVHRVLVNWISHTGIPLMPTKPKRVKDLEVLLPFMKYVRTHRSMQIMSQVFDIPEEDFTI